MENSLVDLLTIGAHFFQNGYMEMPLDPESPYHMKFQHPLSKIESAILSKEVPNINMDLFMAVEKPIQPVFELEIPGKMRLVKLSDYRYALKMKLKIEEDNFDLPYNITEKVREIVGNNLQKQRTYWIIDDRTSEMELIGQKENIAVYAKPGMVDDREIVSVVFKIETPVLNNVQSDLFSKLVCDMMIPGANIAGEFPLQHVVFVHQYVDKMETIRSVHSRAIDYFLEKYTQARLFVPENN